MDKIDLIYDMVKEINDNTQQLRDRVTVTETNTEHIEQEQARTNTRLEVVEKKLTFKHLMKLIAIGAGTSSTVVASVYKIVEYIGS